MFLRKWKLHSAVWNALKAYPDLYRIARNRKIGRVLATIGWYVLWIAAYFFYIHFVRDGSMEGLSENGDYLRIVGLTFLLAFPFLGIGVQRVTGDKCYIGSIDEITISTKAVLGISKKSPTDVPYIRFAITDEAGDLHVCDFEGEQNVRRMQHFHKGDTVAHFSEFTYPVNLTRPKYEVFCICCSNIYFDVRHKCTYCGHSIVHADREQLLSGIIPPEECERPPREPEEESVSL